MTSEPKLGVLFVCLGNICRSPMAEGVFIHLARKRGVLERFDVDSCGTGRWHVGNPPDHRAVAVAFRRGIQLPSIARQLDPKTDFKRFELILAMDRANRDALLVAGAPPEQLYLLRQFDRTTEGHQETGLEVPDPYFGPEDDDEGFERVLDMLETACEGLLDALTEDRADPA